ncbi:MAG: hypothetical protein AAB582_01205 [Patescibacteria group bacterium]|mgnify:CR=1 FL=1
MSQVRVVLRSQAVRGGCQKTRETLSHELGITIPDSPAEIVLLDSEVPDDRNDTLRQTLESLMRNKKLQPRLGPVTQDGFTLYRPVEREVVCAAARRLREVLALPPIEEPEVIQLTLVENGCEPQEQFDIVVGAFAGTRVHNVSTPIPFGIAVEYRHEGGWKEMYALN